MADTPTVSAGPNMSFTLACWVYVIDTGANMGFVGKGSAAVSSNNVEYLLWQYDGDLAFPGREWQRLCALYLVLRARGEPVVSAHWVVRSCCQTSSTSR